MAEIKELTTDELAAMTTPQLLTELRAEKLQFSRRGQVMVVFGDHANLLIHELIARRESGRVTRGEFNNFFVSQRVIRKRQGNAGIISGDFPTTTYFWPGNPRASFVLWYHTDDAGIVDYGDGRYCVRPLELA
jgi:hypothetical protein